ncbi:MAG: TIM barrel protein, partial [Oscillospiraceae bacterium]|nr:TIM barrel protein [Oscillospiraceae bacterium]
TYLDVAFERAVILGAEKIIFGSAGARKRGDLPKEEADRQFLTCLHILEEYCSFYQIPVLLEAIRYGEADYLNTLAEAAEMVSLVEREGCSHIGLMADLYHMDCNREDISNLEKYFLLIGHVHVCEAERKLPSDLFSAYLSAALSLLRGKRYHHTISYESVMPVSDCEGKQACSLLHSMMS